MTFLGGNTGAGLSAKPAEKKKGDPFGPDILHNLVDQVEESAIGLFTGPWYIGKALAGDAKNILTGSHHEFKTDDMVKDIAKTTWDGLKFRWQPLVEGDFSKWWDHVEEDPLGTILDVATVATLGGTAAGSAGVQAARAGGVAATSTARLAGLSKIGHIDEVAKARQAMHAAEGRGDLDFDLAKEFETADIEARFGRNGVVADDGTVFAGPTAKLNIGDQAVEIPLSRNPIIRARQRAGVAASNKFPTTRLIGSESRGARKLKQQHVRETQNEMLLATQVADKAIDALDAEERSALEFANYRQQNLSREDLIKHYEERRAEAIAEANRVREGIEAKGDRATVPKGQKQLRVQLIEERLADLRNDEKWNRAAEENWADGMRHAMHALVNVSHDTTKRIWELQKPLDEDGNPVSFDDFWEHQKSREARHILGDHEDVDVDVDLWEPPKAGDTLPHGDDDAGWIRVEDLAATEERPRRVGGYAHVRPHMMHREFRKHQPLVDTKTSSVADRGLGRGRYNNFTLFDDAMDILDPRTITTAAKQVVQYQAARSRITQVLQHGRHVTTEADIPKGWVLVNGEDVTEFLGEARRWVDEDAAVTFGKSVELEDASKLVDQLEAQLSGQAFAVPGAMHREFMGEITGGRSFFKKYDQATGAWRHLTLSLRPVWITGNFFGQLSLLLTTHGLMKGSLAYFQAFRMSMNRSGVSLPGRIMPGLEGSGVIGAALRDAKERRGKGDARPSREARTLVGESASRVKDALGSAWGVTERINQFNAWLTDDIPRRAAFLAEIKPHVKRIQERTGLSFEEAAEQWLSDPKVVDGLASKVLGDLVDFRTMTEFEKSTMRRLFPFWSWVRGATGRTWRLALDEPWKVWAGNELSEYGVAENEELMGELPDYLKGALPIGEAEDGTQRIIPTNSINPFATAGDVAGIVKSLALGKPQVGGSNPASMMNPFLKSGIETFTDRDLFYGTPLSTSRDEPSEPGFQFSDLGGIADAGYGGRLAERLYHSVPLTRAAEKVGQALGGEPGYTPLYEPSVLDTLMSYFAMPTKQMNVGVANERAAQQRADKTAALI